MRLSRLAALAALLLAPACKDECTPSTDLPFCDGNTVVLCPAPGVDQVVPNKWRRRDCLEEQTCVQDSVNKTAFCALAASPNALCTASRKAACEPEGNMIYCLNGYATSRFPCKTCVSTDTGVDCQGGISTKCTAQTDCALVYTCAQGYCVSPGDR